MDLPQGLGGAYSLMMGQIIRALEGKPDPEYKKELLTKRMLPVLAAAKGILPLQMLARACCNHPANTTDLEKVYKNVEEVLPILRDMFQTLPSSGEQQVQPYHETVLHWLTCTEGMDAGEFKVNVSEGNRRLGLARGKQKGSFRKLLARTITLSSLSFAAYGAVVLGLRYWDCGMDAAKVTKTRSIHALKVAKTWSIHAAEVSKTWSIHAAKGAKTWSIRACQATGRRVRSWCHINSLN